MDVIQRRPANEGSPCRIFFCHKPVCENCVPGKWDEPMSTQVWSDYPSGEGVTWDDAPADAETQRRELGEDKEQEKPIICNAHGIICKKGICREYAKQVRDAEKAQSHAGGGAKKGKGRGRGRGFGRGGGGERGGGSERGGAPDAFRGRGAAVKSNWRGTPRAIVSAAAIERRESINDAESVAVETPNAWGNTTDSGWGAGGEEPEEGVEAQPADDDDGWGKSEASFDPWKPEPAPEPEPWVQQKSQWKPQPQPQSQWRIQSQQKPQFQQKPQPQSQWRSQPQQKPQQQQKPQPQSQSQWKAQPQQKPQPQPNTSTNTNTNTNNAWSNKKTPNSWADEVDAHSAAGYPSEDNFSSVASKRGSGGGGGRGRGRGGAKVPAPKSSTSGWGTVDEQPW